MSSVINAANERCILFGLPRELRDEIWEFAVYQEDGISVRLDAIRKHYDDDHFIYDNIVLPYKSLPLRARSLVLAVTETCKQIRIESVGAVFRVNKLRANPPTNYSGLRCGPRLLHALDNLTRTFSLAPGMLRIHFAAGGVALWYRDGDMLPAKVVGQLISRGIQLELSFDIQTAGWGGIGTPFLLHLASNGQDQAERDVRTGAEQSQQGALGRTMLMGWVGEVFGHADEQH